MKTVVVCVCVCVWWLTPSEQTLKSKEAGAGIPVVRVLKKQALPGCGKKGGPE